MRTVALAIAGALLAGCGGGPARRPTPAPTPSETTPAPIPGAAEVPSGLRAMTPGTYTYGLFQPRLVFTVGTGWNGGHAIPTFFDVQSPSSNIGFGRPDHLYGAGDVSVSASGLSARQAADTIAARRDLRPGKVVATTVAGRAAFAVDLDPRRSAVHLFGGASGDFDTLATQRYRVYAVTVDSALVLVVVMVKLPETPTAFGRAESVVRTVRFVP